MPDPNIPNDLVDVSAAPETVDSAPNDLVDIPEDTSATFVEDRGQMVSVPQTLDGRELDYSMRTQLDGVAKSGFFGMQDLGGQDFMKGMIKGLAHFAVSIPTAFGALMKEQGEVMSLDDKPYEMALPPALFDRGAREISRQVARNTVLDEKMTEWGQKLIDWNKNFVERMNIKPTEGQKFAFDIGSATGSVATSIGLGYLTKNPAVMAVAFGELQKASLYEESRAAGLDPRDASNVSTAGGAAEGMLEFIGTSVFFKAVKVDKILNRTLIRIAEEAIQEGTQTYAEIDVMNLAGVRKTALIDAAKDVAYSMLLGAIASAPVSTASGLFEKGAVKKKLVDIGMSDKAASRAADIIIAQMDEKVAKDPELHRELEIIISKEVSQMSLTNEERDKNAAEVLEFFQKVQGEEETDLDRDIRLEKKAEALAKLEVADASKDKAVIEKAEAEAIAEGVLSENEVNRREMYEVTKAKYDEKKKKKTSPVKKMKFEQQLNKAVEEKLNKLTEQAEELEKTKILLTGVKSMIDQFKHRLDVTKQLDLAPSEVQRIPGVFKTRQGGIPMDEMLDELNSQFPYLGVGNESDLVDFLEQAYTKEKALKSQVKEMQPKYERREELTVLKQKLQDLKQGFREGKSAGKGEKKAAQEVALDLIQQSGLDPENKAKFLTALKNTDINNLADFIDEFDRRAGELELKAEVRDTKQNIQDMLSGTKAKLKSGKPAGKFTPELQRVFDMARGVMKLTKEQAQEKLIANLDALQPGQYPSPEQAIENRLLQMMGGFDNKNLNELKDIESEIELLLTAGKKGAELRMLQQKERRKQVKEDALKTIIGDKPADPRAVLHPMKQWLDHFVNGLGKSFSGWNNLMDIMSQDDKTSKADQSALSKAMSVAESENNEKRGLREATEQVLSDQKDAYEVKTEKALHNRLLENEIKRDLGTFKNSAGETVPLILSKSEAISLWMKFQDSTLHDTLRSEEGNQFTPEMEKALNDFLEAEDIADAKAQLAFYQDFYNTINEIYSRIYGVDLPKNKFYSPISREVDKSPADTFLAEQNFRRSVNPGGLKTRVKNLHPIRIESAQQVLTRHITEMNHFMHWADKITDINAVFGDSDIRKTVEAKFGKGMLRLIDQQIQHFTQGGLDRSETQDIIANAIRKNYSLSVLALKPKIGVLQLTGALAFAADVPIANFMSGLLDFTQDTKSKMAILAESEYLKDRRGGWDRDVKDILSSKFFTDLATSYNNPATRALAKNQLSIKKALLMFNEMGDQAANYLGGWAAYKYAYDKSTQADPELRKQEALKFFADVASKTQQSGDLSQQSSWQRGGGVLRLLTMFQSAQNQYFREEVGAIRNLLAGRMDPKEAAKKMFIYHVLLPQLAQLLANLGRWDDEAKRDQLRALIFGSLNGVFILNDILMSLSRMAMGDGRITDESLRIPPMSMIKGVKDAWKNLDHDEILLEDVLGAVEDLSSKTLGPALGLPIQQLFNYYDGVYDLAQGDVKKGFFKLAGWPPFIVNKKFDEGN